MNLLQRLPVAEAVRTSKLKINNGMFIVPLLLENFSYSAKKIRMKKIFLIRIIVFNLMTTLLYLNSLR